MDLRGPLRVGVGGPVGSGKTALVERLCKKMRGEYDILKRLYGFASGEATYDAIQRLSIRGVPKAQVKGKTDIKKYSDLSIVQEAAKRIK